MRSWLGGKRGGLLLFLLIAAVMTGGLTWATLASLRVERERAQARADAQLFEKFRLALWRLDSYVFPFLAKEASRPYNHYESLYIPPVALMKQGGSWTYCKVYQPSPLISEELPPWVLLHFQTSKELEWCSPQLPPPASQSWFESTAPLVCSPEILQQRARLLEELRSHLQPSVLIKLVGEQEREMALSLGILSTEENRVEPQVGNDLKESNFNAAAPQTAGRNQASFNNLIKSGRFDSDQQARASQRAQIDNSTKQVFQQQVEAPEQPRSEKVQVRVGALTPLWLSVGENANVLVLARLVQVGPQTVCQGVIVDWPSLRAILKDSVSDLFPEADLVPVRNVLPSRPEQTMTALPLQLEPQAVPLVVPEGWTPLRGGLAMAWVALVVTLATVALTGWSLIELSERRIRFVSAVTHELRTPLTTLRLYLDMLTSGMVNDEKHKQEYLHTLHAEAERLHRLIGNVLDYSRLENHRQQPNLRSILVAELIAQVKETWCDRCRDAGKELVVEDTLSPTAGMVTDPALVQQILGNLIDNACKYSRHAADPRIWLRVTKSETRGENTDSTIHFAVEDRGPGVAKSEHRSIFQPFRRGRTVDPSASGVGLGLALAARWTTLLGGVLTLKAPHDQPGACFDVALPLGAGREPSLTSHESRG